MNTSVVRRLLGFELRRVALDEIGVTPSRGRGGRAKLFVKSRNLGGSRTAAPRADLKDRGMPGLTKTARAH